MNKIRFKKLYAFISMVAIGLTIVFLASTMNSNDAKQTPIISENGSYGSNVSDTFNNNVPNNLNNNVSNPSKNFGSKNSFSGYTPIKNQNSTESTTQPGSTVRFSENIRVYDEKYNRELLGINWGAIKIGTTNFYKISVQNTGEKPVTLQLSSTNWTPGISKILLWDYDDKIIETNSTVSITLSLIIVSANVNSFTNDIIISSVYSN